MRTGIIKSYNVKNSTGLITDENGEDICFYLPKLGKNRIMKPLVSFEIVMGKNGLMADSVQFLAGSVFTLLNKPSLKRKPH